MRNKLLLISILAASLLSQMHAGTIPSELTGVWAPPSAKISDGLLSEGYAIYLTEDGLAAVIAAPPPIGAKWHATYDAANHVLTLKIEAKPSEGLMQGMTNRYAYDPKTKTLKPMTSANKEILTRRASQIPKTVIEDLQ